MIYFGLEKKESNLNANGFSFAFRLLVSILPRRNFSRYYLLLPSFLFLRIVKAVPPAAISAKPKMPSRVEEETPPV